MIHRLATLLLALPVPAQVADEPERARVGRPAPAVPVSGSAVRREPASTRALLGRVLLVVETRTAGDGLDEDLAAVTRLARLSTPLVVFVAPDRIVRNRIEGALMLRYPLRTSPGWSESEDARQRFGAPDGPWAALIDKNGILRHVGPLSAQRPLEPLIVQCCADAQPSRLVGEELGSLDALRPVGEGADDALALRGDELFLLRWWTVGCPHCRASLPSLAALAERHDGLTLVPVFHDKGGPAQTDQTLRAYLDELGVKAPFAVDPSWKALRELRKRGALHRATSFSILCDAQGVVRYVHPGPRIHEDDGEHPEAARDLASLDAFVARWLEAERQ